MKKRERVKCGEAWAVRIEREIAGGSTWWVAGEFCGFCTYRDGRWLFRTRDRARDVAAEAEREWCETATVVRVTFYEVRRG